MDRFFAVNNKDPKEQLSQLLYLDCENYGRYDLIVNNLYKNLMPAIYYTALTRGYHSVQFKDLQEDVVFQLVDRRI